MSSLRLDKRLKIASNRLPVSVSTGNDGQYAFSRSSGGLVAGLGGLTRDGPDYTWYGWAGIEIPHEDVEQVAKRLQEEHNAVPVLLGQQLAEKYYDGFSSKYLVLVVQLRLMRADSTIWPMFHYQLDKVSYDEDTATAYRKANEIFADTIARDLEDGDLVWVHDYHLMLLPQLLRERAQQMGIAIRLGFFLHTPFPASDFYTTLPSKTEILDGVLSSDVIGFHTDEYRRHFLEACYDIL